MADSDFGGDDIGDISADFGLDVDFGFDFGGGDFDLSADELAEQEAFSLSNELNDAMATAEAANSGVSGFLNGLLGFSQEASFSNPGQIDTVLDLNLGGIALGMLGGPVGSAAAAAISMMGESLPGDISLNLGSLDSQLSGVTESDMPGNSVDGVQQETGVAALPRKSVETATAVDDEDEESVFSKLQKELTNKFNDFRVDMPTFTRLDPNFGQELLAQILSDKTSEG